MKLVRCDYEVKGYRTDVHLFQRIDGKRVVTVDSSLVPYFYVLEDEMDKLEGIKVQPGYVSTFNR